MKWLTTLVFFVAVQSSYSRIVQPVTYSHTTTNDGEYTSYQNGMQRIHNLHTTPYSRHPSVLTHHYYDPPAENKKVEHVVAAVTPASTLNQTRKIPPRKNDYVAKVSYVRDSGSVSFATTIEDRSREKLSTESPIPKLMVVRKRRPLKPVDVIPVRENNSEDHLVDNNSKISTKNIPAEEVDVWVTSPTDGHNEVIRKSEIGVNMPSKVKAHKIRKIKLKPTTRTSTSAKPIWRDVDLLYKSINDTIPQQENQNKVRSSTESTTSLTPLPFTLNHRKQSIRPMKTFPENSSSDIWKLVGPQPTAAVSPQSLTTTTAFVKLKFGKSVPINYENNFKYRDTDITYPSKNQSKPQQESTDDNDDDEVRINEDVEMDEETVDLEYPDEYNDLTDEEESHHSSDNKETDKDAKHTYESPVKLLKKPLRYSYSRDQKQSATDDDRKSNGNEDSAAEKLTGEEYHKNNYQQRSNNGDIGFVARKTHDHAKKGTLDKKSHQNLYEEEGIHKKRDQEEDDHLNEREIEAAGKKMAKYEVSGKHQKGHSTKGSHNIHKKDEYMKKHEFYDEHHEGDSHQKYNDYAKGHQLKHESSALKHAHNNKDYSEGHKANKNKHKGGHHLDKGLHHVDDHSSNNHYGDLKKHHNRGGSSEDKE